MKAREFAVMIFVIGAVILSTSPQHVRGASGELAAGDHAPAFELPGSDGATYRLADFRGKKVVVLAWFPKAFTGG